MVNDYGEDHYLLNEIPRAFPNITTLVLENSKFTLDRFQFLLDNFKYLASLELTKNTIFHYAEISNEYAINYPTSLRNLKVDQNGEIMVKGNINSIDIKRFKYEDKIHGFDISNQHIPSLVAFEYDTDNDLTADGDFCLALLSSTLNLNV